jgi:hypothetical protein
MGFAVKRSCTKCELTEQSLLVHQGLIIQEQQQLVVDGCWTTSCFGENASTDTQTHRHTKKQSSTEKHIGVLLT